MEWHNYFSFALISLLMVINPGPNMVYLITRTMDAGIKDGLLSLFGISTGFFYIFIDVCFRFVFFNK